MRSNNTERTAWASRLVTAVVRRRRWWWGRSQQGSRKNKDIKLKPSVPPAYSRSGQPPGSAWWAECARSWGVTQHVTVRPVRTIIRRWGAGHGQGSPLTGKAWVPPPALGRGGRGAGAGGRNKLRVCQQCERPMPHTFNLSVVLNAISSTTKHRPAPGAWC